MRVWLAIAVPSALMAINFCTIVAAEFWQARHFKKLMKSFDDDPKAIVGHKRSKKG